MEVSGKRKDPSNTNTKPGSQDDAPLCCQPCQKDGLKVPAHGYCQDCAEHLCESCYKTHRKPAPCRHHVLLDKSHMPKSQSSGLHTVPHDLTEQCQQHRGKLIEYFCHDHNILGCSPCITINHRNCKVDYIPDVSEKYVAGNAYKLLVHALKTLRENFKKMTDGAKANKKLILENKATVKEEIKKFRQEVNSMFDNLEANLQKEADDVFAEESARIDDIATRSAKLLEDIENLQDDVNKLEKANRTNALYIKSKANEALVQDFTSIMVQTQNKNTVSTFAFQPNLTLKEILLGSETRMGELHKSGTESLLIASSKFKGLHGLHTDNLLQKRYTDFEVRRKNINETLKAKPSGEINIKTLSDKDCCSPGVVVIGKDTLAVIDSINKAVKIVDTKRKTIVSNKQLSSRPAGVEILPCDLLGITFPDEAKLLFLSIADGLSEVCCLKLDGKCRDLSYHDGKLVVTFEWPGKIQVMSLEGHIFKTIENDSSGTSFDAPMVTVSGNKNIYISDWNLGTITCMNWNGEIIHTYKDKSLAKTCGMVVLADGSILACSRGNETIHIVSENLETGRVILQKKDGLLCPWSLALDSEKNKLYVGSGDKCNYLKVYDLK